MGKALIENNEIGSLVREMVCIKCHVNKGTSLFYREPRNTTGYQKTCKDCTLKSSRANYLKTKSIVNARSTAWRNANHERSNGFARKHRSVFKDRYEEARLMYEYGITFADYERMNETQKGLCAICVKPCRTGKKLCVDHNHATGQVRGLLCRGCNSAIGLLLEDKSILESAIKYLSS